MSVRRDLIWASLAGVLTSVAAFVWPLHRVQLADLAVDVLASADIPAYARTRYHRTLLFSFGPHLPIELVVPADRAGDTRALLASLFDAPAPS